MTLTKERLIEAVYYNIGEVMNKFIQKVEMLLEIIKGEYGCF